LSTKCLQASTDSPKLCRFFILRAKKQHADWVLLTSLISCLEHGFFEKLVTFVKELSEEDQRKIAEHLTKERPSIFDILARPRSDLPRKEKKEVKKIARSLLNKLKEAKLVID
jgi:hypothetical protein